MDRLFYMTTMHHVATNAISGATASAQFSALSSLCRLTKETVDGGLSQFHSTKFISSELISSNLFKNTIESLVNAFTTLLAQTFTQKLIMIRGMIQGNALMTAYENKLEVDCPRSRAI